MFSFDERKFILNGKANGQNNGVDTPKKDLCSS
jgi:hypothetical protein